MIALRTHRVVGDDQFVAGQAHILNGRIVVGQFGRLRCAPRASAVVGAAAVNRIGQRLRNKPSKLASCN